MNTPFTTLSLRGLELSLFLGWPSEERQQTQTISIDLNMRFSTPPSACETDQLSDTYCYDTLVSALKVQFGNKKFKLIEHLTRELYQFIKTQFPNDTLLSLRVTKQPSIAQLTQGVAFTYGDENIAW